MSRFFVMCLLHQGSPLLPLSLPLRKESRRENRRPRRQGKKEALKEVRKGMQDEMDEAFARKNQSFQEHAKNKDTDQFWWLWSRAVGEAWLEALEIDKEIAEAMKGRGEVKVIKKVPNKAEVKKAEGARGKLMYKATEKLRQARRCEQVISRLKSFKSV